ncbi:MAG: OmpA family protein [Candidatus Omnitrophota bacterium]
MMRTLVLLICLGFIVSGCALNVYKSTPKDQATIAELQGEVGRIDQLRKQETTRLESEVEKLKRQREEEKAQFEAIKKELQSKLKDKRIGLDIGDRGLVITLADNILFDSGKADIKKDADSTLDQIAAVINTTAANKNIGVEGHTDNEPIKHSGWKSNRELSTARANNVYHYLVKQGVNPARLTTMGYGEYRPVGSNDTEEGRARNRRVEIVILPEFTKKAEAKTADVVGEKAMVK